MSAASAIAEVIVLSDSSDEEPPPHKRRRGNDSGGAAREDARGSSAHGGGAAREDARGSSAHGSGAAREDARGSSAHGGAAGAGGGARARGTLRLLTWNVDGLNETGLEARARAVVAEVVASRPDVVLLQEVVAANAAILRGGLAAAGFSWHDGGAGRKFAYHVVIALRSASARMRPGSGELTEFGDTAMGRHVVRLDADVSGVHVRLLTSHLESTGDAACSARRVAQFSELLLELSTSDAELTLFGGDTNLRDAEAKEARARMLGANAGSVPDAWEALGSAPATRWTWDTGTNKNCGIAASIKCRFDRVFYAAPRGGRATSMQLLGLQRVPALGLHPSDHYGILTEFQLTAGGGGGGGGGASRGSG